MGAMGSDAPVELPLEPDDDRYTHRVIWSGEDEMYVGLCAEFGFLSHLDAAPEAALAGIRDVVAFAVSSLREDGEPIPEPIDPVGRRSSA